MEVLVALRLRVCSKRMVLVLISFQSDLLILTHPSLSSGEQDKLFPCRMNTVGRTFPTCFTSSNLLVPGIPRGYLRQRCAFSTFSQQLRIVAYLHVHALG